MPRTRVCGPHGWPPALAIEFMIRSGTVPDVQRDSGDWVFVDIGFSTRTASSALLVGDGLPERVPFGALVQRVVQIARQGSTRLNLLIEAPLSVAFNDRGNPTARTLEKRGRQTRCWYAGPGPGVLVAATYLLRHVHESQLARDVRLFEGFVSFKFKEFPSSHAGDVVKLRSVVWRSRECQQSILAPNQIRVNPGDLLISAFRVCGMDFGVPPIVVVDR